MDIVSLYDETMFLEKHIPFLSGFLFLLFGIFLLIMGRYAKKQTRHLPNTQTPIQKYLTDADAENDDGRIPEHARGRAKTPDGLG